MDHNAINKATAAAATGISLATIGLFPLFFLPLTSNYFETNKLILLIVATSLLLLVAATKIAITKAITFKFIPFSLPLVAYGLIHFISSFIATPKSPVESLMGRGSFFLVLGLFVMLTSSLIDNKRFIKQAIYTLIGSGTVLSIISIFQSLGFGLSNIINKMAGTTIPNTTAFTPAGSPLALLTFLAPVILLGLFLAITKTDAVEKISLFILSAFMTASFIILSLYSFPGKETAPVFLPLKAGYNIAIETLKNPKTAFLGVGTNSFTVAYTKSRPASMNTSEFWNIRFSNASNEIFQILTTVGVVGLVSFLVIVNTMVKTAKYAAKSTQLRSFKVVSFGLLLLLVLIPGNFLLFFMLYLMLMLWGMQLKQSDEVTMRSIDVAVGQMGDRPATMKLIGVYTPAVVMVVMSVTTLYFAGRAYAGELVFKQSMDAATKNDGVKTYDLQRKAILNNPYSARYRRSYAATNLALANALASNKDISDQEKANVAQLIQQAIREAKVAVSLEPENVVNWENLTMVYRSLVGAAQGADEWTIASLSQAIQADPFNPTLRVELGGIYYSLGRYDQAIRLFQQATELKPDFANAYYNLSHAYFEKKDVPAAYEYMRQTVTLLKTDAADYTKAKEELEALSKQLPKDETEKRDPNGVPAAKTELQVPSPAPSPSTGVNLPTDSGPENVLN